MIEIRIKPYKKATPHNAIITFTEIKSGTKKDMTINS